MKPLSRAVSLLLFLLLLLPPCSAWAQEGENDTAALSRTANDTAPIGQEGTEAFASVKSVLDRDLCQQIEDVYAAAQKLGRRSSFKGYCGSYVANQLVALGINTARLCANGNRTYDIYRNMDRTTGGYDVVAFGAREYSLREALNAIMAEDPAAGNILVGFEKSTSKAGRKYGHVLFIHGIRQGNIYFSDSCARTVDGVIFAEGEPIVCSLDAFVELYSKCKLDGVIHFVKEKEALPAQSTEPAMEEGTAVVSSEKLSAVG